MKYYKLLLVASFTAFNLQSIVAQQLKPGDIVPKAKVIDADNLFPFFMGAAVIQKGNSYALIDKEGNFIVPYNKYDKIVHLNAGFGVHETNSGFFTVNGLNDVINSKGKLLTEGLKGYTWGISPDGKFISGYDNLRQNFVCIDENGQKYILKKDITNIVDGIGIVLETPAYKRGYKNIKDEWIVKPVYDEAEPFSDGMACVGKKDQFGEMKYGFIDKTGKEVIPPIYSRKPENFYGGLARVEPKSTADFREAYIDKKGNIVRKFNELKSFVYFGNGLYSVNQRYTDLMDSTGSIVTKDEFLQRFGVSLQSSTQRGLALTLGSQNPSFNTGKICFLRTYKSGQTPTKGFMDLKTGTVVEGYFDIPVSILVPFLFSDPVSKLSSAKFYPNGDYRDRNAIREGYINEQGIFIMVKAKASNW